MRTKKSNILIELKSFLLIGLIVACVLMLPFLAMQFTNSVEWSFADFVFAGIVLFGTGVAYELISKKANSLEYRAAIGLALFTALFLLWSNLAVGIVGSEDNSFNALYLTVHSVLLLGSLAAWFTPRGMELTLYAAALTQLLVTTLALVLGNNLEVIEILIINLFFITLWLASGLLFRRARMISKTSSN